MLRRTACFLAGPLPHGSSAPGQRGLRGRCQTKGVAEPLREKARRTIQNSGVVRFAREPADDLCLPQAPVNALLALVREGLGMRPGNDFVLPRPLEAVERTSQNGQQSTGTPYTGDSGNGAHSGSGVLDFVRWQWEQQEIDREVRLSALRLQEEQAVNSRLRHSERSAFGCGKRRGRQGSTRTYSAVCRSRRHAAFGC